MKNIIEDMVALNDEQFVREVYQILFRREADEGGLQNNVEMLKNGALSRDEMVYHLRMSPEGVGQDVPLNGLRLKKMNVGDITRHDSKNFTVAAYLALLGRTPGIEEIVESERMQNEGIDKEKILSFIEQSHREELVGIEITTKGKATKKKGFFDSFKAEKRLEEEKVFIYKGLDEKDEYSGVFMYRLKQIEDKVAALERQIEALMEENERLRNEASSLSFPISAPLTEKQWKVVETVLDGREIHSVLDVNSASFVFARKMKEKGADVVVVRNKINKEEDMNFVVSNSDTVSFLENVESNTYDLISYLSTVEGIAAASLKRVLMHSYEALKEDGILMIRVNNGRLASLKQEDNVQYTVEVLMDVLRNVGFSKIEKTSLGKEEIIPVDEEDELAVRTMASYFNDDTAYLLCAYKG
ncbi:MAG: DUF4214 domain-containing protein [Solobacterium sp.]|nr:DUF4214 domain-containing protein [Solobacterium sp.]